jgi:hypothetical protein
VSALCKHIVAKSELNSARGIRAHFELNAIVSKNGNSSKPWYLVTAGERVFLSVGLVRRKFSPKCENDFLPGMAWFVGEQAHMSKREN